MKINYKIKMKINILIEMKMKTWGIKMISKSHHSDREKVYFKKQFNRID